MANSTDLLASIKVIPSKWIPRGQIVALGAKTKPENWKNMTRDEQLRWAINNATAVALNPLDVAEIKNA